MNCTEEAKKEQKNEIIMKSTLLLFLLFLLGCQKTEPASDQHQSSSTFWEREDPSKHGFNLSSLENTISNAAGLPNFYALLVVRNGKLVVEEYFRGKNGNDLFHLRSITKNFTSAITGKAIEEGYLTNTGLSVKDYYPNQVTGEKEQITVHDLLNMTSGLEWNENQEIIPLINNEVSNPITYYLSKDLVQTPGTAFNYCSLSAHVVANIIETSAKVSFETYTKQKLFEPLGIRQYDWEKDPDGKVWGGFGLQLRARDLAKFGLLYLNKGLWENEQLISKEWVNTAATKQINIGTSGNGYSYQWWHSNSFDNLVYYGSGYGGQALFIVPNKKMVVVGFHEYFVQGDEASKQWRNFVDKVFKPIYEAAE